MAADIVEIVQDSQSSNHATQPTIAAIVIGSIGLSPLILAFAGMLHEIHYRLLFATKTRSEASTINRWLWVAQVQIHGVVVVAMVLLIIGGINLATATPTSDVSGDEKLRHAGAILIVLVWLGLVQYSGWLLYRCYQSRASVRQSVLKFVKWNLVAGLIIGIRVIYAVVYTFDTSDTAINPVTGSLAVKVVLTVAVTLAAVLAMAFAGWVSRDAPKYRRIAVAQEQEESSYPMMKTGSPTVE